MARKWLSCGLLASAVALFVLAITLIRTPIEEFAVVHRVIGAGENTSEAFQANEGAYSVFWKGNGSGDVTINARKPAVFSPSGRATAGIDEAVSIGNLVRGGNVNEIEYSVASNSGGELFIVGVHASFEWEVTDLVGRGIGVLALIAAFATIYGAVWMYVHSSRRFRETLEQGGWR